MLTKQFKQMSLDVIDRTARILSGMMLSMTELNAEKFSANYDEIINLLSDAASQVGVSSPQDLTWIDTDFKATPSSANGDMANIEQEKDSFKKIAQAVFDRCMKLKTVLADLRINEGKLDLHPFALECSPEEVQQLIDAYSKWGEDISQAINNVLGDEFSEDPVSEFQDALDYIFDEVDMSVSPIYKAHPVGTFDVYDISAILDGVMDSVMSQEKTTPSAVEKQYDTMISAIEKTVDLLRKLLTLKSEEANISKSYIKHYRKGFAKGIIRFNNM